MALLVVVFPISHLPGSDQLIALLLSVPAPLSMPTRICGSELPPGSWPALPPYFLSHGDFMFFCPRRIHGHANVNGEQVRPAFPAHDRHTGFFIVKIFRHSRRHSGPLWEIPSATTPLSAHMIISAFFSIQISARRWIPAICVTAVSSLPRPAQRLGDPFPVPAALLHGLRIQRTDPADSLLQFFFQIQNVPPLPVLYLQTPGLQTVFSSGAGRDLRPHRYIAQVGTGLFLSDPMGQGIDFPAPQSLAFCTARCRASTAARSTAASIDEYVSFLSP